MELLKPDSLDKVDAEIKFAVVVLCDVISSVVELGEVSPIEIAVVVDVDCSESVVRSVPSKTEESVETSSFDTDVV